MVAPAAFIWGRSAPSSARDYVVCRCFSFFTLARPPAPVGALVGSMKEYAKGFYKSKAWKECRAAYAKSVGGLCEVCLQSGVYRAGEIVHHKEHINPDNISDPQIILDWNNLQLVCRDCHAALHPKGRGRRYKLDDLGRVILTGD